MYFEAAGLLENGKVMWLVDFKTAADRGPLPRKSRLPHGTVPYALLLTGVLLVLLATGSRRPDTLYHVAVGAGSVAAGALGARTCKHVRHQAAVTAGLVLLEAFFCVWLVG
jgi:hypothetical protein